MTKAKRKPRANRYYRTKDGRWRVIRAKDGRHVFSKKPTRQYLDKSGRLRSPKTGKLVKKGGRKKVSSLTLAGAFRRIRKHLKDSTLITWKQSTKKLKTRIWLSITAWENKEGTDYLGFLTALESMEEDKALAKAFASYRLIKIVEKVIDPNLNGGSVSNKHVNSDWLSISSAIEWPDAIGQAVGNVRAYANPNRYADSLIFAMEIKLG